MKYNSKKFKYSRDEGVWHDASPAYCAPPGVMIKGNRSAEVGYGLDTFGFKWNLSTLDHWSFNVDATFDEAHSWVRDGTGSSDAWFDKPIEEDQFRDEYFSPEDPNQ
jgi:hypothetical protein